MKIKQLSLLSEAARTRRDDAILLLALLCFTLAFRLLTLMMIHTGVDEGDYWYAAKALVRGLPYPDLTHRTIRWAVILPTALAQLILGTKSQVYYVLPILNSLVQVALIFSIGRRLRGRLTAFLASLSLILFPYMIRAGSQLRPEIFSLTYTLLALYTLLHYLEAKNRKNQIKYLAFLIVWIFISYEAKITNLFFLPGFALSIWLLKGRFKDALILCVALFVLYLGETAAYALFSSYPLGQLQIIATNHLSDTAVQIDNMRFIDLFRRYSSEFLQAYWQLPLALFAVLSIIYSIRTKDRGIKALIICAASFFFFLTFAIGGIHPLKPAEAFINRYFSAVLGFVLLFLSLVFEDLILRFFPHIIPRKNIVYFSGLALLLCLFVVAFSFKEKLPSSIREYANSPLTLDDHPLALLSRYRELANESYKQGIPLVAEKGGAGDNALQAVSRFLLDESLYVDGRYPQIRSLANQNYLYLSNQELSRLPKQYIKVTRNPLKLE